MIQTPRSIPARFLLGLLVVTVIAVTIALIGDRERALWTSEMAVAVGLDENGRPVAQPGSVDRIKLVARALVRGWPYRTLPQIERSIVTDFSTDAVRAISDEKWREWYLSQFALVMYMGNPTFFDRAEAIPLILSGAVEITESNPDLPSRFWVNVVLIWIVLALVYGAGFAGFRAMRARRRINRLRRRVCLQCAYDLQGGMTDVCPECGATGEAV